MWKLYQSDSEYYKPGKLGVAYKTFEFMVMLLKVIIKQPYRTGIEYARNIFNKFRKDNDDYSFDILKPMEGLIKPGEVTVVLGRPGLVVRLLKTIACRTEGFHVADGSVISYDGITQDEIRNHLRGEVVYCAETETHFPKFNRWRNS